MASEWIVIGISGVTCGGKTTLADKLKEALHPVYVFHQDRYFYSDDSPKHVRCEGLDHNNYDILSALDMDAMYRDVIGTMRGAERAHSQGGRAAPGKLHVPGKKFLVIEGFTVLNYTPLMDICDYRYYLVLEYGECFSRRALRLYEPPDVAGYFETCVWPEHLKYRAQIERDPRVTILEGAGSDPFYVVMADLKRGGAREIEN
ncbi:nicotinamide riboside kinase 2 [Danaus plexippus]|uniref:nicotinamide riboside kinase 2 n=1 Tax=Danaus plexippus TaxID=13037 RepID=UPI002AB0CAFF|nr:nicotinamide riboside kinase 2 [Danaus plexippus]XP_061384685.1 nicotinamide riboside kinase 2 [Danaus plexippus]